MKVFVTGATGYCGAEVVKILLAEGHDVGKYCACYVLQGDSQQMTLICCHHAQSIQLVLSLTAVVETDLNISLKRCHLTEWIAYLVWRGAHAAHADGHGHCG